jgi:VanZ family protein
MMRRGLAIIVAGYWVAIFIATHLPHVPVAIAAPSADKWEHLAAYAALAFLLAIWQLYRQPLQWRDLCRIAASVALYGAFDELTQIPVGRHADVMDWFADIAGTVLGLALFAIVQALVVSRGEPPETASGPQ